MQTYNVHFGIKSNQLCKWIQLFFLVLNWLIFFRLNNRQVCRKYSWVHQQVFRFDSVFIIFKWYVMANLISLIMKMPEWIERSMGQTHLHHTIWPKSQHRSIFIIRKTMTQPQYRTQLNCFQSWKTWNQLIWFHLMILAMLILLTADSYLELSMKSSSVTSTKPMGYNWMFNFNAIPRMGRLRFLQNLSELPMYYTYSAKYLV